VARICRGTSGSCVDLLRVQQKDTVEYPDALRQQHPDVRAYGFRPGVVDTEMQGEIRASGINRVSKLRRDELLAPSIPAAGVTWLVRHAPADLSGQEVDIRDESFKARMAA
jgi:NADP-dependent 3-hydroxy acid dehydrogenase YdfG